MGVVYRAMDTTLDRDVAIKVLPESMAADADRLARFEREAKILASLNHPNIATIHGLERADGTTALVMELVEGPTLADRIEQGAIPADEALGIAMQIAEALEAAHGQGIVHRDLKPANIKLRSDGTVKVLDFGIAKALEPENLTSGPQSPMMTTPATMAGVILGTAAYMSPEQAKGKQIDQRTDIWAFGCVLYEMLTGQLAFGAEDVPTTLARVIDRDTDMDSLPAAISPAVRQTIQVCLQKDVRKRVADIRDVRLALEGSFETDSPQVTTVAQPLWRRVLPFGAAILVTGLIVGLADEILWPEPELGPPPVTRFDYDLPEGHTFRETNRIVISLSPDGRHFVYNTTDGLYLRTMSELEPRLISGTEISASSPSFSPDGQSVVYVDDELDQIKRIAVSGGAPVVIADLTSNAEGLNWNADNTILVGQDREGAYRVSANGGTPELVISIAEDELVYRPQQLPDGDSVLFSLLPQAGDTWDAAQTVAQSLSTGERTVLVEGGTDARYLPTGHLVYALNDGLFAVAFDLDSLAVSGGAVPLVQGVMRAIGGGAGTGNLNPAANFSVSENGTLVYVAGSIGVDTSTLVWVDREGRETPLDVPPRAYTYPRISPDGTKVALDVRDQELDIWVWDFTRETLTRLTFGPEQDEFPVWSPDGQRIAYNSAGGIAGTTGGSTLSWRASDGTGQVELLAEGAGQLYPASFLPDGTGILARVGVNANDDIAVVNLEEDGAVPLLASTFNELNPEISPDGRWLAYTTNESGNYEVYVRSFPDVDGGGRWQVSTDGGMHPLWARNEQELFYRNDDAIMAVSIETDPTFVAGNPEALFEGSYFRAAGGRTYDVSLDGEQFLMIKQVEGATTTPQIIVVENWFEELNRLAPTE